jgi:predicted dinucleotide-binding enzyme/DMSO/TMAO reductase YedYZ heme-binding membrane subunit
MSTPQLERSSVSIVGTGDFGRALAKPLLAAGVTVLLGSRHPEKRGAALSERDPALRPGHVCSVEEAVTGSHIIFLALHPAAQQQLSHAFPTLQDKLLIDVSNVPPATNNHQLSNAEQLQQLFPQCRVVKAFNTVSAASLSRGEGDVAVAGDDEAAVASVVALARRMGLRAVVRGKLDAARQLEASSASLFTGWGAPLIVAAITFLAWLTYAIVRTHIIKNTAWSRLPMNTVAKCYGTTAITLLALCYLPGSIAAFTQLIRGTKHTPFSPFLDRWLRMRKELGLMALWLAVTHTVSSLPQINPAYYDKWFSDYEVTIPANQTSDITFRISQRMDWIGECVVACGVLALSFMSVLGVSSLPSVAARMNWRQWRFVQSHLGYVTLALAAAHVSFITCPGWSSKPFKETVQGMGFLSVQLPYFTLLLRLILLLPCLSRPLDNIRHGWERGANNDIEASKTQPRTNANGIHNGGNKGAENHAYDIEMAATNIKL